MLVAGRLQDLGCEVETALNGTDAFAKLNGKPFVEMLITDVNMPGMSGHELAERAMAYATWVEGRSVVGSRDGPAWPACYSEAPPSR